MERIESKQFVETEWEQAFSEEFEFLKNIPSSNLLPRVGLIMKDKELFTFDFLCQLATDKSSIPKETLEKIVELYFEEKNSSISYMPINDIKSMLKHFLTECEDDEERKLYKNAQNAFEKIKTPSAKETRKVFFPIIEKTFNKKPQNEGGGCWSIPITVNNNQMKLVIDFGGRITTMTYWVDVYPDMKPEKIVFASYEDIMGFLDPNWDLMRSDLLDQHAQTFVEVVNRTIKALSTIVK